MKSSSSSLSSLSYSNLSSSLSYYYQLNHHHNNRILHHPIKILTTTHTSFLPAKEAMGIFPIIGAKTTTNRAKKRE
jgi:hypothetical protein